MAMSVALQDENGNSISKTVQDPEGVVVKCLPDPADAAYACVRFIDPYGNTVFNRLQAAAMTDEWDRLKDSFSERNAETLWADVRRLIVLCSDEPHTYLKFTGD